MQLLVDGWGAPEILIWESDLEEQILNPDPELEEYNPKPGVPVIQSVLATIEGGAVWSPLCLFVTPSSYGLRFVPLFITRQARLMPYVEASELRQADEDLMGQLAERGFTRSEEHVPNAPDRPFNRSLEVIMTAQANVHTLTHLLRAVIYGLLIRKQPHIVAAIPSKLYRIVQFQTM